MEYADGGTLRNYLSENFENLTWEAKLSLASQLAHATSCLHDEGIVHRDLVGYCLVFTIYSYCAEELYAITYFIYCLIIALK
jgi:serine/threonine protein kinase